MKVMLIMKENEDFCELDDRKVGRWVRRTGEVGGIQKRIPLGGCLYAAFQTAAVSDLFGPEHFRLLVFQMVPKCRPAWKVYGEFIFGTLLGVFACTCTLFFDRSR